MPIYSYICKDCSAKFDLLMGVTSKDEEKICKKCGSKNIEKTFASFAVNVSSGKSSPIPTAPSCPAGTRGPSCPTGAFGPSCPTGTCPTNF